MMKCPVDNETLMMTERQGVEIDYCPKCRGIWLDRGELDKLIEVAARQAMPASAQPEPASGRSVPPPPPPMAAPEPAGYRPAADPHASPAARPSERMGYDQARRAPGDGSDPRSPGNWNRGEERREERRDERRETRRDEWRDDRRDDRRDRRDDDDDDYREYDDRDGRRGRKKGRFGDFLGDIFDF